VHLFFIALFCVMVLLSACIGLDTGHNVRFCLGVKNSKSFVFQIDDMYIIELLQAHALS
jgi:hypothetical protein